jgi:hypothetical protein
MYCLGYTMSDRRLCKRKKLVSLLHQTSTEGWCKQVRFNVKSFIYRLTRHVCFIMYVQILLCDVLCPKGKPRMRWRSGPST